MYVHRAAVFTTNPAATVKELQGEVKKHTNCYFRRINKFIILTLLGMHRCLDHEPVPPSTAIFLTTESGNMFDTEAVLDHMYHEHEFPMPVNFINTMNNTASFYAAQSIGAESRNLTLSSKGFSFERGLQLARCDLQTGAVSSLLVGGVDVMVFSHEQMKEKLGEALDPYPLVEASAWIYITPEKKGALAEILEIQTFAELEKALKWTRRFPKEKSAVAFSMAVPDSEKKLWMDAAGADSVFDYLAEYGYCDSAAACGLSGFVSGRSKKRLIHVNKNGKGRYLLTLVRNL